MIVMQCILPLCLLGRDSLYGVGVAAYVFRFFHVDVSYF
jgi:hypothetical protein